MFVEAFLKIYIFQLTGQIQYYQENYYHMYVTQKIRFRVN